MAILHRAEIHPSKLELLAGWLPGKRWFRGPAEPRLTRLAAFRFDDPAGEVGVETLLVSAGDELVYQVPLTYRDAPLPGRDASLVGTCEHSVLGKRWVYDACGDPVYVAALAAAVLRGDGQAEEHIEVDGRLERREPSMSIASTVADARPVPAIGQVDGVLDSDEVTSIISTPLILTVVRGLELTVPPPSTLPALTGAWPGQPRPIVLALALTR
ncbi:hypothetical protein AB0M54_23535 [Actinoplanes sp. NPDC051470]|uniref:CG0192-related protein n=1 Tax=unclassified Actinoplanes TaxID=2626549 RepID=UPI003447B311